MESIPGVTEVDPDVNANTSGTLITLKISANSYDEDELKSVAKEALANILKDPRIGYASFSMGVSAQTIRSTSVLPTLGVSAQARRIASGGASHGGQQQRARPYQLEGPSAAYWIRRPFVRCQKSARFGARPSPWARQCHAELLQLVVVFSGVPRKCLNPPA